MLGPDALAWRDRHYGQSSCPQGRRRARENRGNRRNAAAPTPLFSRSQSDRAVLRKTQSSPAQVRRALHPRPLGSNRNNPPDLHSRRVQQLLHTRRIWAKMRGIRSRLGAAHPSHPATGRFAEFRNPMPRKFAWASLPDDQLLQLRFKDLKVTVEGTWLEARLADLHDELGRRGLRIRP